MAMSKRHFEKLAKILRAERNEPTVGEACQREREAICKSLAESIADVCREESPRFDRERFLAACEPK